MKLKKQNENSILYLLIILLLLIVFVYHCNYNKKVKNTKKLEEGFKTKYSEKHLAGKKLVSNPKGNPLLPRSNQNITLVSCQGDFGKKESTIENSQKEKLYLDSKSDGVVLLPKGYIKVDLDNYEKVDSIILKGLKKGRIDVNNGKDNEYKHLFDINTEFCNDLLEYNKLNINQINRINPENTFKVKSLKITNVSSQKSEPIKLELMKVYNAKMKTNKQENRISDKKILDNNNKEINRLLVNEENNFKSFVSIVLPKPILLNGFSLKTNIGNIKVITKNNGFKDGELLNGGINGVVPINYYFNEPVKTKNIKIIPFIDPKKISDKDYFITDINIYSYSKNLNIKEGFANENNEDNIINQLKASTDIQQACQALAYQEDINRESHKLQQFKKYNLKLQKQEQELEELNRVINKLKEKRRQQMEKEDVLNVVKYQKLKGEEVKLLEKLKENKNKSIDLNLNLIESESD